MASTRMQEAAPRSRSLLPGRWRLTYRATRPARAGRMRRGRRRASHNSHRHLTGGRLMILLPVPASSPYSKAPALQALLCLPGKQGPVQQNEVSNQPHVNLSATVLSLGAASAVAGDQKEGQGHRVVTRLTDPRWPRSRPRTAPLGLTAPVDSPPLAHIVKYRLEPIQCQLTNQAGHCMEVGCGPPATKERSTL